MFSGSEDVEAVTLAGAVEDFAGGDVERGEEVGGPVELLVMGHRAGPTGPQRRRRLRAIECLALRFLV